ncbi:MAG TPA: RagB/SusD family nutrient uptake outer membrane protein, partial [Chryseolinea sp.]|nr:RagB/SusD family nutrient uptake outer membrane protein [Chryseolinea sp.]
MKAIENLKWYAFLTVLCLGMSCEDFLDKQPQGTTTLNVLSGQSQGAEGLLIAAYSNLDGFSTNAGGKYADFTGSGSNWTFGSIAGGDAYKGSDEADQADISEIELHSSLTSLNTYLEAKWITYYNGIARANDAIKAFWSVPDIKPEFQQVRIAEARFLRGFFHLELYRTFGKIPYINDSITDVRIGKTEEILTRILDDFAFAAEHLPYEQEQIGRVTKGAANAYAGITKMWQHKYADAIPYFDAVITSGIYQLCATFHDNFNVELKNDNKEAVLQVQQSVKDGASGLNGNPGDVLNLPGYNPNTCCGFHLPSQNLVNAFQTDADGLPLLYTYNDNDVTNDDNLHSSDPFVPHTGPLDPRIDWTVGRRGLPYLDRGAHAGEDWVRGDPVYAG